MVFTIENLVEIFTDFNFLFILKFNIRFTSQNNILKIKIME